MTERQWVFFISLLLLISTGISGLVYLSGGENSPYLTIITHYSPPVDQLLLIQKHFQKSKLTINQDLLAKLQSIFSKRIEIPLVLEISPIGTTQPFKSHP